jgi:phosphatidylserine/phosphatidylglycerophosphate/cardiolipin synthase-like enzyme
MRPKRSRFALALVWFLLVAIFPPALPGVAGDWEVYFSPRGGCTQAIVKEVGKAGASVLVQAYSFSSWPIAKALVEAHQRGVQVKVILDQSQVHEKYSTLKYLATAGVPTWIDAAHHIAHNKVMVIDGATVITGSFNFTRSAEEENAENLLIIHDQALAAHYAENWQKHAGHSQLVGGNPN